MYRPQSTPGSKESGVVRIESYVRQESKFWRYSALTDPTEVPLTSLSIELPTGEIYRGLPLIAP